MNEYLFCLKQCLKRPAVAMTLASAALEHRRVEEEFRRRVLDAAPPDAELSFPHLDLPAIQYWERNFFSILFLSIFELLGIPKPRRRQYGLILHAVRGIVTAADNVLDQQDAGAVRLHVAGGRVLPNVMLILLQQDVIGRVVSEVATDTTRGHNLRRELLAALFAIAREECEDEPATESVLPPEQILDQVHHFRGGRLLELAFVAPEHVETERAEKLGVAKAAVHQIGLALQILDDVTDLAEDVGRRSHNILRSWIVCRCSDGPVSDEDLAAMSEADLSAPEAAFPKATRAVLGLAVETALEGFAGLEQLGHAIGPDAGSELMETLFRLRGLQRLWEFWTRESPTPGAEGPTPA